MPNVMTIREAVKRAKAEGMPVSEYTLRHWIRTGQLPTRKVGNKVLLFYPNLVRFLECADGCDNPASVAETGGIRRVEA